MVVAVGGVLAAVGSCGDDGGASVDAGPPVDAKKFLDAMIDAGPPTVMKVTCPAVPDLDGDVGITGGGTAAMYDPKMTNIHVGGIVRFSTQATHDVSPAAGACAGCISDAGIHVDFSKVECRQFTAAGKFGFACSNHGFVGQINVTTP